MPTLLSGLRAALIGMMIVLVGSLSAYGHEVRPAVADIEFRDGLATVTIDMNAEAYVAGINLTEVSDTNEAEAAETYDTLRALEPAALEERLRALWPQMREKLSVQSDGQSLETELTTVTVPEIGDIELLRDTRIVVTAPLPAGANAVSFGWARDLGPIAVRQVGAGENAYTGYLTEGQASAPIPVDGGAVETDFWGTFANYVVIGFEHIIPKGLDHILFVLGLFFLSLKLKPLLLQITAFTIAHTVTLALATLGIVSVPAAVVEPLIAASIVYVAVENIFSRGFSPWRLPVVFGFGLLHGLGFASVLGDIGLDPSHLIAGLIAFNIGVELGQLTVIALAFLAVGIWFKSKDWYRSAIATPASAVIACIGAYWFVERVFL